MRTGAHLLAGHLQGSAACTSEGAKRLDTPQALVRSTHFAGLAAGTAIAKSFARSPPDRPEGTKPERTMSPTEGIAMISSLLGILPIVIGLGLAALLATTR